MFKVIEGTEGKYSVSPFGEVKGMRGLLSQSETNGYYMVGIKIHGAFRQVLVHRLVAKAFLSNPDGLPQVNHKDENKLNNHIDNLEWCTAQYNMEYSHAKSYTLISPTGEVTEVFNLRQFCKANGLTDSYMLKVLSGKHKQHKGWTRP